MPTSFPGDIPSFTELVDNQDDILAEHQNVPNDEITAIATLLGNIGSGLTQAYSADMLAFLLGAAKSNFNVSYLDADTVRVSAGTAIITNAGGSQRVARRNASTVDVDGSDLDSGGPTLATSTRYYLYAEGDSIATTCGFVLSTNPTTPSGYTRYLLIGRFDTDSSGNIIEDSVISTLVMNAASNGSLVKETSVYESDEIACSNAIPADNSVPQNTEGNEVMTLDYYPVSSTNKLVIEVVAHGSADSGNGQQNAAALFKDSDASAIGVGTSGHPTSSQSMSNIFFAAEMDAGTTNKITFKVRFGSSVTSSTFNGQGGSRLFGGVLKSSIRVKEYKA